MVLGGPLVVLELGVVIVVDIGGIHQLVEGEFGGVEGSGFGKFGVGLAGLGVVEGYLGAAQVGEDFGFQFVVGFGHVADHLLALEHVLLGLDDIDDGVFVLDFRSFDHHHEMHPVFAGGAVGDDEFLQLLVFVVVHILGFHLGAFGHDGEHLVEDLVELGGGYVGTVLRHAHVVGLLAFGRGPAGDADLLGQALFEHDALEVEVGVVGVEFAVHFEVPVKVGGAVEEVDVGGFDDALGLVVVDGGDGDVALDVDPRGGVVDSVGDEHGGEFDALVGVEHILHKAGVLVGVTGFVAYGRQGDTAGLHAGFEVEHVAIGEATAFGVVDDGAVAVHLLTLEGDRLQRYVAAFPRENGLQEHSAAFVEVFFGNLAREFHHDFVVHGLHGVGVGLVAHFVAA